jgi:hypothetical protein
MAFGSCSSDDYLRGHSNEEWRNLTDKIAASVTKQVERSLFCAGQETVSRVLTTMSNIDSHDA